MMSIMIRQGICLVILVMFFACTTTDQGKNRPSFPVEKPPTEDIIVNADGWATILQKDKSLARDRAIKNAMYNAVRKAIGTMIEGESIVSGGVLVSQEIRAKAFGFVKKYDILKEYIDEDVFVVSIKAVVSKKKIKESIRDLLEKLGKPKIAIMIGEKINKKELPVWDAISSSEISNYLLQKGYEVIDISLLRNFVGSDYEKALFNIDMAVNCLRRSGIEVLVLGTGKVRDAGSVVEGSNLHSFQADLNIKVVDVGNKTLIFTDMEHSVYPHISLQSGPVLAIKKAAKKIAEKIDNRLRQYWLDIIKSGKIISLTVKGITAKTMNKFYDNLRLYIRGVEAIYHRDLRANILYAEMRFRGNVQDLVDERRTKNIGFKIKIRAISSNGLYLSIR